MKTKITLIVAIILGCESLVWALSNAEPATDDQLVSQVMIMTAGRDDQNQEAPGYCNATVVAPDLLVTAAHCVCQAYLLEAPQVQIFAGHYHYVKRPNGQVVNIGYVNEVTQTVNADFWMSPAAVSQTQSDGLQVNIVPQEDYAVIHLRQPMKWPANMVMRPVVAAGLAENLASQAASLNPQVCAENPTAYVSTTNFKQIASLNDLEWQGDGTFQSRSTARLDEGDSGSGLLIHWQGKLALLGVAKGQGSNFFSNWDEYVLAAGKICELSALNSGTASQRQALCGN